MHLKYWVLIILTFLISCKSTINLNCRYIDNSGKVHEFLTDSIVKSEWRIGLLYGEKYGNYYIQNRNVVIDYSQITSFEKSDFQITLNSLSKDSIIKLKVRDVYGRNCAFVKFYTFSGTQQKTALTNEIGNVTIFSNVDSLLFFDNGQFQDFKIEINDSLRGKDIDIRLGFKDYFAFSDSTIYIKMKDLRKIDVE